MRLTTLLVIIFDFDFINLCFWVHKFFPSRTVINICWHTKLEAESLHLLILIIKFNVNAFAHRGHF